MLDQLYHVMMYLIAVIATAIAIFIFWQNRQSQLHRWIAFAIQSSAVWVMLQIFTSSLGIPLLGSVAFSFGSLTISSILIFAILFTEKSISSKRLWLIVGTATIIAILSPWPGMLFDESAVVNGIFMTKGTGPVLVLFELFYFACGIFTAIYLFRGFKILSGTEKLQWKYFAVGMISSWILATTVSMIMPMLGQFTYLKYGAFSMLLYSVPMIYVATKHHLAESQVIFSEIWAFILLFAVLAELLIRRDVMSLILFILTVGIGLLLVRSVISEAKKRLDLRRNNIQLAKAKQDLERVGAMKDEFIKVSVKELNMPIEAIHKVLSVLIKSKNSVSGQELEPVFDAARRLKEISSDLAEVSLLEQGGIWLQKQPLDLDEIIDKAVEDNQKSAEKNGLKLIRPKENLLPEIFADKNKIYKVIYHLIENAIKFTPNGSVTVKTEVRDDGVMVSVADTGVGIPKEDQKDVFHKFFQPRHGSDNAPKARPGVGLGMYLTKNIIDLHQGKISLESEVGKGTTFHVYLPTAAKSKENVSLALVKKTV